MRNDKQKLSGSRKTILDGNLDLHKEIKHTPNGKYIGKSESIKNVFKHS